MLQSLAKYPTYKDLYENNLGIWKLVSLIREYICAESRHSLRGQYFSKKCSLYLGVLL